MIRSRMHIPQRVSAAIRRRILPGVLLILAMLPAGCNRQYWRNQADTLSYDILRSKQRDPRWSFPRLEARPPDPRSRFYDPYDIDCPPLPPDDPTAHEYMHWVYGMQGYKGWHKFGDTDTVENPNWLDRYGLTPAHVSANHGRPAVLPELKPLTLEEAVRLAYIHNRDYQLQMENLYLNALALTIERFHFDLQYFGLSNRAPSSDLTFAPDPGSPGTPSSLTSYNRVGVGRFLPTGGQWLAELANNTLWLFSGGNQQSSTSTTISYSVVQPLLANGGRRFALENLTQVERNVLYYVRNFAWYRQGFFATILFGQGPTVTNFAGQSASGAIGTNFTSSATQATIVTLASGGGGGGGGGGIGGGVGNVGGYFGLLQQHQQIRNQLNNIRLTEEQLELLRAKASQRPAEIGEPLPALPAGFAIPPAWADRLRYEAPQQSLILRGTISEVEEQELVALSADPAYQRAIRGLAQRASADTTPLSVAQLESNLAGFYVTLYTSERALQDSYDIFKVNQLGLPTDMSVVVDTSMLKPFDFIDPALMDRERALREFVRQWGTQNFDEPDLATIRQLTRDFAALRDDVQKFGFGPTDEDFQRVAANREHRLSELTEPAERQQYQKDMERAERLYIYLQEDFAKSNLKLKELETRLAAPNPPPAVMRGALRTLAELREELLKITQGLEVVQIDLRVELVSLIPFDMSMEEVLGIGLENRVDLMNARGQVMDGRRKIEVAANQLQAVLNIVAAGDIRTKPNSAGIQNPFAFSASQNSYNVGVQFTTPVQLVNQRNNYRAAQIFYQQARRNYMLAEDSVKATIRGDWRQLMVLKKNFELSRQQLRISAVQYDIAVEQTAAPAQVGQAAGLANPGLNILQALSQVLNAQNAMINIWVNYESNRLQVYRDMGIMRIDEQGFWDDNFYQARLRAEAEAGPPPEPRPEDLPPSWLTTQAKEPHDGSPEQPSGVAAPIQPASAVESAQRASSARGGAAVSQREDQQPADPGYARLGGAGGDRGGVRPAVLPASQRQPPFDYRSRQARAAGALDH